MFAKMCCRSSYLVLILLALLPLLVGLHPVQALSCKISRFNIDSPGSVGPGQPVQVITTFNIACTQSEGGTYYTGRVDLVDSARKAVLSRGIFTVGARPNATAAVADNATAPQTSGTWDLEIILYIFEGGGIVALSDHPFAVQVSPVPVPLSGPNTDYVAIAAVIAAVIVVGLVLVLARMRKRNA